MFEKKQRMILVKSVSLSKLSAVIGNGIYVRNQINAAAIDALLDLLKNELIIKQNIITVIEYRNRKNQIVEKLEFVNTATPSLTRHLNRSVMIVMVIVRRIIDFVNHAIQCRLSLKPMIFIASFRRRSFSIVKS